MPIDTTIDKSKKESDALARAKGKNGASFANTFFGTVNELFYEFGVITPRKNRKKEKKEGE